MEARNPRTGIYDYSFDIPAAAEVQQTCSMLKQHQPVWEAAGVARRIAVLQQWKLAVEAHKTTLVQALTADTGRHWETLLEADLVAASIDRWCSTAAAFFTPPQRKTSTVPFLDMQQDYAAYPLVGVISPWNFPLLLSLIDTIPALLAGCAVVVKPSEVTPRFIAVLQQTIAAVPALAAVLQYLPGDGATGAELVKQCSLICFTGSTATGRKVYEAAAANMIPVFLEMGGKDPAIVLEGADLELAASSILWGSTANAGQSCLSIERVYVQQPVFDPFVQLLAAKAAALPLAAPGAADGRIGPIIFEKQVHIINSHLEDALAKGATVVTGSTRCEAISGGWYCRPTVLTGVNHSMKIMTEETFGPIMPVMPFATKEEAIALANGTDYGLSGAVFAATTDEAIALAGHISGGAISINDCALTAIMHEGEKQSFKLSGIGGTRMGPGALRRFVRQKVLLIKTNAEKDPWWGG